MVTGTRADFGLQAPVMRAVADHPGLKLQVVATGMHLLRRFGYTVDEVEAAGWRIDAKVRLQGERDDVIGQSRGLGRAITGLTNAFAELRTDIVVVLGDRLEMFAAAAAATASQRVLGHVHSGDAAMGVQDDAYRFAISKLAHLHFAAAAGAKRRLGWLGEESFRIYQTGSPALDNLSRDICRDAGELSEWAGFDVNDDFLLVMQHPSGGTARQEERRMTETLRACVDKGLSILVLYPNCDAGFSGIINSAERFCKSGGGVLRRNLPRRAYLGLLVRAKMLVGNSSSGIIEAGYLNVDVVNVGPRQTGRERSKNVLDVGYGRAAVSAAIERLLRRRRGGNRKIASLYGDGRSGRRIASILARVKLDGRLRQKRIAY